MVKGDVEAGRLTRAAWACLALLIVVGVTAVVGRAIHLIDAAQRLEPIRQSVLGALGITDPLAWRRADDVAVFDAAFASHRVITMLHIVSGGAFLLLLPLQLSARVRRRRPALHRLMGRVLMGTGLVMVATALYFGLLMPFAGTLEAVAIATVSAWYLYAAARAIMAIRAGQVTLHREWMIRAIAVPVGVSVVRIVGLVADLALLPLALAPSIILGISLWVGWLVTLIGAEMWVRRTRGRIADAPELAVAAA